MMDHSYLYILKKRIISILVYIIHILYVKTAWNQPKNGLEIIIIATQDTIFMSFHLAAILKHYFCHPVVFIKKQHMINLIMSSCFTILIFFKNLSMSFSMHSYS